MTMHSSLLGLSIVLDSTIIDGAIYLDGVRSRKIIVGTRPLTPVEQAHEDARRIVQTGLADVLRWLGRPAYQRPPTHQEVLEWLS